jgi:hypothetical protein
MIRHAHSDDDWIESLSDRLAYTQQDLARPARLRRLKSLQRDWTFPRKLLILLGLLILAAGLTFISSIFGYLTRSF